MTRRGRRSFGLVRIVVAALLAIGVPSVVPPAGGSARVPAISHVSAPSRQTTSSARTLLYAGKKEVGELEREQAHSFSVMSLNGTGVGVVAILRNGAVQVGESLTPYANGYARPRPGGTWLVNVYRRGKIKPFGTVRRRSATEWVAYKGLGSQAHRVGYATGPHANFGALAVLLISCICDG
jgi:hypothetical protein